jgi:TonB-linked SusC/RagA family outer membrane protein
MRQILTKMCFSALCVVLLTSTAISQKTISGVVADATSGEALIGANVLVKGTAIGTITDFDGNYSLRANEGDVLVFSYSGYESQEATVGASNVINVTLAAGKLLEEVVVVGYGSQRSKEITSAVVSVGREDFNQGPIADAAQLLQGKVAGLQTYNRGGDPNQPSVIRMRGISTVGANAEPLIVIDGIIGASLSNIDPADIETMDVLKDGSASAIYGTRGSAGVIIITTRKGSSKKGGGINLSYNGQVGAQSVLRSVPVMNAAEFRAAGGADLGSDTDWLREITQIGLNRVNNLSAEGGVGNTTFRASANLRNVDGILQTSGFDQLNTRLNVTTKALNDKLTVDFNTSFTNRNQDFSFNEAFRYATLYNPTAPVLGANSPFPFASEQFGGYFETLGLFDSFNPSSIINQNYNRGKAREFNVGANLKYNILDNLSAHVNIANQSNTFASRAYYPTTSFFRGNATSPTRKGLANFYNNESNFQLYEGFLVYLLDLGDKSNLTFTGGYSYQQTNFRDVNFSLGDFPNNDLDWSNNIGVSQDFQNRNFISGSSSATPDEKIIAFFGRANYTFDDAIFVNASLRREGSTRFGEGNQWGLFPAVGLGVDINRYANINNVDLFKVRLGYGVTGALPPFHGLSQPIRRIENGPDGSVTTILDRAANPDLQWEEKKETNVGIDFKSGRLGATLDVYNRDIDGFLLERIVDASIFGAERRWENAGALNTKGLELALNYDVIQKSDFSYNTGIIFSTYKTVLSDYVIEEDIAGNLGAPGQNGTNMIRVKKGEEVGQIWGPVFSGNVSENGEPIMTDLNGDGQIIAGQDNWNNPNGDFAVLGKGIPDFELGWTNSINYKGWNVNAFFRGAFGHSLVNTWRAFYEPRISTQTSYNFVNSSLAVDGLTAARFSSLYVERADFFMLDNLTISRNIGSNKYFKNVNLSLTGQNLFIITKYTGASPEPSLVDYGASDNGAVVNYSSGNPLAPGIDRRSNYLMARTFTFGINFNF